MNINLILWSIVVFLAIILVLVAVLLFAKSKLVASGPVKLAINGDTEMEVESGSTLLNTLAVNGVHLPSACGGKGSCGQCTCQVVSGGGEILPSEVEVPNRFHKPSIADRYQGRHADRRQTVECGPPVL